MQLEWMSVKKFAKKYNLEYRTVLGLVKTKKLVGFEYKKVGGLWRIKG